VGPLASNELSIPVEDRIRRDDPRDFLENLSTERLALHGQPTALVVGGAHALSPALSLEDTALLDQVVDDVSLVAVHPTGHGDHEELPGVQRVRAHRW